MATLKIYKLQFTSPLHISDCRDDYSVSLRNIASDTMYASLTACLAKMGEAIPADGDLGCTISSLFPYYQKSVDTDPVYFLPMPLRSMPYNLNDQTKAKAIKKVAWVDSKYYSDILNGKDLVCDGKEELARIKKAYYTDMDIDPDFICAELMQRASMPCRTGHEDTVPYFMERLSFKGTSGMYFICSGNTTLIDKAIALLSTEGIGTDRNVGNGFFNYSTDTIEISLPAESTGILSLSMFLPENKEELEQLMTSDKVAYNIERRGGWITTYPYSTLRKNVVYMITHGSVLARSVDDITIMGRIVDLCPEDLVKHPIWRCGKSIMLPIKQ